MKTKNTEILALALSLVLTGLPLLVLCASNGPDTGGATEAAAMSSSELQALVAPIALYPDALVAQVLSAATFPDQVAIADYWIQQHKAQQGDHEYSVRAPSYANGMS